MSFHTKAGHANFHPNINMGMRRIYLDSLGLCAFMVISMFFCSQQLVHIL
jgi:hypothetical protein